MKYYSFTVARGMGAAWQVYTATNLTTASLTVQTRRTSAAPWTANTDIIAEGLTSGVRIVIVNTSPVEPVLPCEYRILANGDPIVNGNINYFEHLGTTTYGTYA